MSRTVAQLLARVLAVLALCAVLALLSDAFLTRGNMVNVLRQTSLLFFLASGLTLVVLTAGLDLSVGANISLAACVAGTAMKATGEPLLGAALGLGIGAAVGLCNGLMVAVLRIPSFIATYGMLWVLQGAAYAYMAGQPVYGFPRAFRVIGIGTVGGIPVPILLMAAVLALGSVFTARTIWGQQIYAIGANAVAARLSGVPVKRRLILVYLLQRRDHGPRRADLPRPPQLRRGRYRRRADAAGDRRGADRRRVAVRRRRLACSAPSSARCC